MYIIIKKLDNDVVSISETIKFVKTQSNGHKIICDEYEVEYIYTSSDDMMWNVSEYFYSTSDEINEYSTIEAVVYKDGRGYIDIDLLMDSKKSEISTACNTAIKNGFDCTLSDDKTGHFSLEETDQINLTNAMMAITLGATKYPYHADGEICKNYLAEDIVAISTKATQHKLYHTTYCNHVYKWIERCETIEELDAIYYGADLPDDLQESMNEILGIADDE